MLRLIMLYCVTAALFISCSQLTEINKEPGSKETERTNNHIHQDAPPETAILGQLLGTWDAYQVKMNRDGTWSSDTAHYQWNWYPILDGHGIQDDWIKIDSVNGSRVELEIVGTNIRIFNSVENRWHMNWIDKMQRKSLIFTAINHEGTVVMSGKNAKGRPTRNTFYNLTPETFDWKQEWTFDNGTSWVTVSKIHCQRKD